MKGRGEILASNVPSSSKTGEPESRGCGPLDYEHGDVPFGPLLVYVERCPPLSKSSARGLGGTEDNDVDMWGGREDKRFGG